MRWQAAIGAGIALAACTSIQPAPPIAGTEWRVAALNGERIDGTGTRASFRDNDFMISFGCNTGSGRYRVQGGQLIPVEGVAVTEMACMPADASRPNLMERERRGFAIVSRPMMVVWQNERRVTLSNEAGSIDLGR